MRLTTFLKQTNLERSLLIGYYGGGNYGDELLLEVLQNLLHGQGVRGASIVYLDPEAFRSMHHDFGYSLIDAASKAQLLRAALRSKNIIVGGGGLWGVDMNLSTFLMSLFLFMCRKALRKKVYLLGVGYYNSTTYLGRLGAWFAGKAANLILARDTESLTNFTKITSNVERDIDIAWYISELNLQAYEPDAAGLNKILRPEDRTIIMAPRRVQAKRQKQEFNHFNELLAECVAANPDKHITMLMAESESRSPELFAWARALRTKYKQLRLLDVVPNPLALFLFFRNNHGRLGLIAPQLHLIITAYLTDTTFMPIVYDNKVHAALLRMGIPNSKQLALPEVHGAELQRFIDDYVKGE